MLDRPTLPRLVAALALVVLTAWGAPADAYRLRYGLPWSGGCDFRVGWHVAAVGQRLFAGGPWDQNDCGTYAYGLVVFDLATGTFERELLGTYAAVEAGSHLVLGHVDGVQVVDPVTFAVARTIVGPNAGDPWITLQGAVAGDMLVVAAGDTPETADLQVVYRIAPATGAVLQRYVVPQPHPHTRLLDAAGGDGLIAIGSFSLVDSSSAGGVFVFGADDGALRWSAATPAGGYSARVGRAVAVDAGHVAVGIPGRYPDRGQVHIFSAQTGALERTLMAPGSAPLAPAAYPLDGFGRAVAAAGGRIVVGARGIGTQEQPGRGFLYDAADGRLLDVLAAPAEVSIGDAVAFGPGGVIVVGGNDFDGMIDVFEPGSPTTTTTSTTQPPHMTTTTTLPCAAGCDDGDPCTVDSCIAGQCDLRPLPGFAACRAAQLRDDAGCAPARVARRLTRPLARAAALAAALRDAPAARQSRLQRRLTRRFAAYCAVLERTRARLTPTCAGRLALGCRYPKRAFDA